jgi:hypothetical protein
MGWKGKSDITTGSCREWTVEIEKDPASAHILGFGVEFVFLIETNHCRQAHIKAPHHPPFLRVRLHPWRIFRKHAVQRRPIQMQNGNQLSGWKDKATPTTGPWLPTMYRIASALQEQK